MALFTKHFTCTHTCSSPVVEATGDVLVASSSGEILRISDKSGAATASVVARTGGQAQGIGFDVAGRLLVCDLAHQSVCTHSQATLV